MMIDIGRIEEDLYNARMMDIEAEVRARIDGIREEVIKERDNKVAELEKLLAQLDYYTCEDEEEEEEEAEEGSEEVEEAETNEAEEIPSTVEE